MKLVFDSKDAARGWIDWFLNANPDASPVDLVHAAYLQGFAAGRGETALENEEPRW